MKSILIIWDIDGTLINPKGTGRLAMNRAFHTAYGIMNAFEGIQMSGRLDGIIVRDAFRKHKIPDVNIGSFYDIYCRVLEEIIQQKNIIELLPGVRNILEYKDFGFNVYHILGTGNLKRGARIKLQAHDLNKYFPCGGFGDEGLERWEIIEKAVKEAEALTRTKFERENIYVIGDTPFDIECAKKLGVKSIAVATGSHSYEELLKHTPDNIFLNLEDFKEFFNIFNK